MFSDMALIMFTTYVGNARGEVSNWLTTPAYQGDTHYISIPPQKKKKKIHRKKKKKNKATKSQQSHSVPEGNSKVTIPSFKKRTELMQEYLNNVKICVCSTEETECANFLEINGTFFRGPSFIVVNTMIMMVISRVSTHSMLCHLKC